MSAPLPKAALYISPRSVWASAPRLALEEKGYGADEIDIKEVDLSKGENFAPSYLRLNPHATVPTLVVPLQKTLAPEIESRYKAVQDTQSIIEFLDKSRSALSRTHTTSNAPAPSLTPATIAFSAASKKVIELLHSDPANPNLLLFLSARDDESLKTLAKARLPFLLGRREALTKLLNDNESALIRVSEKTKKFWESKLTEQDGFIKVYEDADKPVSGLSEVARKKREDYFATAAQAWQALGEVLQNLHKEIIGPYTLGDQLCVADLHLAAWLTRIVLLAGATAADDGNTVTSKLEARIGASFVLPKEFSVAEARRRAGLLPTDVDSSEMQNRLAAFWDAVKQRPSWKKVYADGLH